MPSPENGPFADFINDLNPQDFSNFTGKVDNDTELTQEEKTESIQLIGTPGKSKFVYNVEVGLASLTTTIDTDLTEGSLFLSFPSKVNHFAVDDMHESMTRIFDLAFPRQQYQIKAKVGNSNQQNDFNLSSYWDGKLYEKALEENPTSVIYYSNDMNRSSLVSAPSLMYGFHRNEREVREYARMSYYKGSNVDKDFLQELLLRNKGYLGKNIDADSLDLREKIYTLCKTHPQEKIM